MQFTYKVADADGRIECGREEAVNSEQLLLMLKARGKLPLEIKSEARLVSKLKQQRFSIKDRLSFTQQLAGLLNAGISLEKALAIINRLSFNGEMGLVIVELYRYIQEGHSFTAALEKFPRQFPPIYINLVRAGEAGGLLPGVLNRLVEYEDEQLKLQNFIIGSLVYPVILALATLFVLLLYVVVVIPKFQTIFAEMDANLPLITQVVMVCGLGVKNYWWLLPLALIALLLTLSKLGTTFEGRLRIDRFKLRLPYIGEIFQKTAIARLSMSLSMLCISGVPLLSGLEMAAEVSGNLALAEALRGVITEVKQGSTLVNSMAGQKVFPVLALEMIGVGEESGNLGEMLSQVAKTYETEVKQKISLSLAIFEPVLILIMVGVIGVLAAAILLPIMNLNSEIGF